MDGEKIIQCVKVDFLTDFRVVVGTLSYTFRWVIGLFSIAV